MATRRRYAVPSQHGRRIVVTGANSGLGREAAKRLAAAGAEVVMAVRTMAKGDAARAEIEAEVPGALLEVRRIDLADLASVREFAAGIVAEGRPVHVLVNNAGVMAPSARFETVDGFELQLGSDFLGPFALTQLLLPTLLSADEPRVVTMSSMMAEVGRIHLDDLNELPDGDSARRDRRRARLGASQHRGASRLHAHEPADGRSEPRS